jgi:hypothetical protein
VWEKVNQHENRFTWVAYGLGANGLPVYVLRAVGVGKIQECDRVDFTGWLQVFAPNQNIWSDTPLMSIPIDEFATRMPVAVVK